MGIARAFLQDACRSIAGVIASDSYCVHRLRVAWNSYGRPVPKTVQDELDKPYNLQTFDINDQWSDL